MMSEGGLKAAQVLGVNSTGGVSGLQAVMDSDEDGVLTKAEIDAIEDDMLTDEVHKDAAMRADADKDGSLTWDEYLAWKSPPLAEKEEL